ncbi:MAG: RadC family protein [Alphaproteobacteria bacterium]
MDDKPHYLGHRQRLRERFMNGGADALPDYEMLELVLFQAHPRADMKPLAKRLIDRFGSFSDAISAPPERLLEINGVGESTVAVFKIVREAGIRLTKAKALEKPVISSWSALSDYCSASMAYQSIEQLRVLFLDKRNRIIADEILQEGSVDHTPVYPRQVAKRALALDATALILVHNHPSGDPEPSQPDVEMTKLVVAAAKACEIVVHDHVIIGRGSHVSMRSMGLM